MALASGACHSMWGDAKCNGTAQGSQRAHTTDVRIPVLIVRTETLLPGLCVRSECAQACWRPVVVRAKVACYVIIEGCSGQPEWASDHIVQVTGDLKTAWACNSQRRPSQGQKVCLKLQTGALHCISSLPVLSMPFRT